MHGPGVLDPIPEDTSVVAASQHAVNLSTVSAVASSDSGGMVDPRAQKATKKRRVRRRLSNERGTGIEDNVSDVNASLCGGNALSSRKSTLSKVEEAPKSYLLSTACKKWSLIFLAILLILAVAIGLGMYFMVAKVPEQILQESSSPSQTPKPPKLVVTYSTESPTSSPAYSPEEVKMIDDAIVEVFGTTIGNIFDMNTPEGRGRDWMINSDGGIVPSEEQRVKQRYILSVFHFATNGDFWHTKWLDPERSECEWFGVTCNTKNSIIERIDIGENNVTGTIPNEIVSLSNLISLNVSSNNITGTIPSRFFDFLTDLETLHMQQNQMSGKIPERSFLVTQSALRSLDLGTNQFTGMFPFFYNVESVRFGFNNLTSFDSLYTTDSQSLREFSGYHNELTGTLPTVWNANELIELDLGYNYLSGTIPQDLWDLESLKTLWLDHCNLTGPLPSSSKSASMHRLWLDSNLLSGAIPVDFGMNWTKLYSVKLQENLLTGSITSEQCNRWKAPGSANNFMEGSFSAINENDSLRKKNWVFKTDCEIDCACCTNSNCSSATPSNIDGRR